MYISPDTLNILKNFSEINPSILIESGNQLHALSTHKNVLADAKVAESFPVRFAIYDLNEFLSVVSLFKQPAYEFTDKYVTIKEDNGKSHVRYNFADPSTIESLKPSLIENSSNMEKRYKPEISFNFTEENFDSIMKAARVLQVPELAVTSDGTEINFVALDTKNSSSNTFNLVVGDGNGTPFSMVFKVENLKLLKGPYGVKISSKGVSRFSHQGIDLNYFIALEAERSSYGAAA